MKYRTQKIAYWFFATCMLLLSLQLVYGFIMAFAHAGFDVLHDVVPFHVARATHNNLLVVWLLCGFMGAAYFIIPEEADRELMWPRLAYVGSAFGPYAGFISGVLLWMLGTFATAAVATVFASSLGLLVPALSGRWMEVAVLVAVFAFWSIINVRGVGLGVRLNSIATVAKLLPLVLIALAGAFFVDTENLRIAAMPPAADIARTSLLLIFAFAGIEVALVPSGEVRDTARTVPRAIALAMIAITLLYIALQMVAQGILGSDLAKATVSPLADAAGASLGGWARSLLLVGATVSMFGYLGGMTLSMPRMLFALARDRFLPRSLAAVHPHYRSPHAAIAAQSLVALALAVSGTFERLAIFANVSALALYLGCALAAWQLRRESTEAARTSFVALGGLVPWLACLVIAWLLTGLTRNEWLGFVGCLAGATLIYVAARNRSALATSHSS